LILKSESVKNAMIQSPQDHSVELTLPNELGYERIAMACSAALAKMHGCLDDRIEDLKTVVAEAAINAMQHGNQWRPESRVIVKIEVAEDTIHVSVTDEGSGLREEVADPDIERLIEKNVPAVGFGLFLMRNLADRIEFDRMSGGGHRVRISIRMQPRVETRKAESHLTAGNQG
jgi:anti-sigma regulatory factor (Ser/Thr protein kinase)